jgi:hypothetical protein
MPDSGGSAGDSIPQGNAGEVSPDSGMMARLPGSNISETKQLQTPSYWRGSVSLQSEGVCLRIGIRILRVWAETRKNSFRSARCCC